MGRMYKVLNLEFAHLRSILFVLLGGKMTRFVLLWPLDELQCYAIVHLLFLTAYNKGCLCVTFQQVIFVIIGRCDGA